MMVCVRIGFFMFFVRSFKFLIVNKVLPLTGISNYTFHKLRAFAINSFRLSENDYYAIK